jgi:hypothetical protein
MTGDPAWVATASQMPAEVGSWILGYGSKLPWTSSTLGHQERPPHPAVDRGGPCGREFITLDWGFLTEGA